MVLSETKSLLAAATCILFAGSLNYLYTNPSLPVFVFLDINTEKIWHGNSLTSRFFSGYFSDICWCISLCMTVLALEVNNKINLAGKLLLLSTPFMSEVFQLYKIFPGVFDWNDIIIYLIIIFLFFTIYPLSKQFKMKTLKSLIYPFFVICIFLLLAMASVSSKKTYHPPPKQPCSKHKPLDYSPLLVKINLSGSYTMKDLPGAQRFGFQYIMDELNSLSPYKYKLADGEKPNLELNITVNTDSYQHYGATLYGYVYDGNFYNSWNTDYITAERLFDDIAKQVNIYIRNGWCKNCPDPCIIN